VSDVIELRELRVSAVVGILPQERTQAQPLVFDLDIERSFKKAAKKDDINETTNYALIITLTQRIAVEGKFLLLETLCDRVASEILDFDPAISSVTVMVKKVVPPVPEDIASVGVRCTRKRK
jgi:hypothetical protein